MVCCEFVIPKERNRRLLHFSERPSTCHVALGVSGFLNVQKRSNEMKTSVTFCISPYQVFFEASLGRSYSFISLVSVTKDAGYINVPQAVFP